MALFVIEGVLVEPWCVLFWLGFGLVCLFLAAGFPRFLGGRVVAYLLPLVDNCANVDEIELVSVAALALGLQLDPLFFFLLEQAVDTVFKVRGGFFPALAARFSD